MSAGAPLSPASTLDAVRLGDLLEKTSRTFALSIPVLPEPTRREVALAYLLFRIADTFEDAETWSRKRKIDALADFARLLDPRDLAAAERATALWLEEPPCDHEGYLELLAETPAVLAAYHDLDPAARELVRLHTQRTADGMAGFVARTNEDGVLQLRDVEDLKAYCYVVAGIVGEMLTELFVLPTPGLGLVAEGLRRRAASFGEALQLVNILKDSAADARFGRHYLPNDGDRSPIFGLARHDLGAAREYVRLLEEGGAPRGVTTFCALPVLLAGASLDRIEKEGPGAKISRPEVFALVAELEARLDAGSPAL